MTVCLVILCSIFACLGPAAMSQDTAQSPHDAVRYYNRTFAGIMTGGQHGLVTGSLLTIHGVSVGGFVLGIGAGLEGYERWRTVPTFGSMSYHFRGARNKGLFIQLNGGHSTCWLLTPREDIDADGTKGGPTFSSTLGYQIASNNFLLNIAAGYKVQKMRGSYTSPWQPLQYTIDETANRFIFQIGFGIL